MMLEILALLGTLGTLLVLLLLICATMSAVISHTGRRLAGRFLRRAVSWTLRRGPGFSVRAPVRSLSKENSPRRQCLSNLPRRSIHQGIAPPPSEKPYASQQSGENRDGVVARRLAALPAAGSTPANSPIGQPAKTIYYLMALGAGRGCSEHGMSITGSIRVFQRRNVSTAVPEPLLFL